MIKKRSKTWVGLIRMMDPSFNHLEEETCGEILIWNNQNLISFE